MVRLIGVVLILLGTVGIGYDRMQQIKRHYKGLLDWRECMLKIQGDKETAAGYYCRIGASCTGRLSVLFYAGS